MHNHMHCLPLLQEQMRDCSVNVDARVKHSLVMHWLRVIDLQVSQPISIMHHMQEGVSMTYLCQPQGVVQAHSHKVL